MPTVFRITAIRILCLVGIAVSSFLAVDHFRPGPAFCPLEQACAAAAESELGSFAGIPTSLIGLGAFAILLLITLPELRRARKLLFPVGFAALGAGLGFLVFQAVALENFCPLCVVADGAAVLAGLLAVTWWTAPSHRLSWQAGESKGAKVAWVLAGCLVGTLPFALPRETPPPFEEAPEISDDAFLAMERAGAGEPTPEELALSQVPAPPYEDAQAHEAAPATSAVPELPPTLVTETPDVPPPTSPAIPDSVPAEPPPARTSEASRVSPSQPVADTDPAPAASQEPEGPQQGEAPGRDVPARTMPTKKDDATRTAERPAAPSVPARSARTAPTPDAQPREAAPERTAPAEGDAPPKPAREPSQAPVRPIRVVEYLNAYCKHCRRTHDRLEQLLETFPHPVEVRRVYTWRGNAHPLWARACAWAADLGREEALFTELLKARNQRDSEVYRAIERAGLSVPRFRQAMRSTRRHPRLVVHQRLQSKASLRGLPTLDIGRRRLVGEQHAPALLAALRAAKASLEAPRNANDDS